MIPETKPLDPVEIESLFVPLDGSEWHERAISYAVLMSKWFGSTIDLFFSLADVPPLTRHGEWRQRAHLSLETPAETPNRSESIVNNGAIHEFGKILASDYLNEITSRMKHLGIDVETDLSAGSPAHILSHKAQQHDNSIIVMYARPQHRLYRYVRKKMAEELLSVATVPLLMINDDPEVDIHDENLEPTSVIVPLRIRSAMDASLPYAINIAQKTGVGIRILESNVEYRRNRNLFDLSREFTLAALDASGVDYRILAYDLGLTESLNRAHRASPNSWIVMGSRLRRGFSRQFLPSVADNIRREVSCPVFAVPQSEVIDDRKQKLHKWLVDWLAHQNPASMIDPRTPTTSRARNLERQMADVYAFDGPDRRGQTSDND